MFNFSTFTKKLLLSVFCLVLSFVLLSCNTADVDDKEQADDLHKFSQEGFYGFDTLTWIIGYEPDEASFNQNVKWISQRMEHYHKLFTCFEENEYSNVYYLNKEAGKGAVSVDHDLYDLLALSLQLAEESQGAFNPCIGQVSELWRNAREEAEQGGEAKLPSQSDLEEAAQHIDYHRVILHEEDYSVEFLDPQIQLDLGAIAKGYALDLLMQDMADHGLEHYIISIGGNVKALGPKPDGQPWEVGIQDPFESTAIVDKIPISESSVVTSGIYERYYFVNGERYHHIINPKTLYPSKLYASVTIIHPRSGLADGLATALFNLNHKEGEALAKTHGAEVVWIDENKEISKLRN